MFSLLYFRPCYKCTGTLYTEIPQGSSMLVIYLCHALSLGEWPTTSTTHADFSKS